MKLEKYDPAALLVTVLHYNKNIISISVRYGGSQDAPESGKFAQGLAEFALGKRIPLRPEQMLECEAWLRNGNVYAHMKTFHAPTAGAPRVEFAVVGPDMGTPDIFLKQPRGTTLIPTDVPSGCDR